MSDKTTTTKAVKRTRSLSKGYVDLIVELRNKPETVFDVVIVGSGYGGSIAAQQLAGLKNLAGEPLKIAVLERGSEYLPGMFPSAFADLPKHIRFARQSTGKVTGELEGLYDVRLGDDVNALVANGLGGGSLINAGVMLEPNFDSFESDLPQSLISELTLGAEGGYLQKAKKLLLQDPLQLNLAALPLKNTIKRHQDYSPNPQGVFPLKFNRLEELGAGVKSADQHAHFEAAEISVAMRDVPESQYSIKMNACVACGDCMTGCNVGAKASLNTNLLAQAQRDGVEIYTGASVLTLKRAVEIEGAVFDVVDTKKLWQLEVVHTSLALRKREPKKNKDSEVEKTADQLPAVLKAHHVILAAGTLGSTEILLRSRSATLAFSNKLGERFSCNGDNIAAIHDLPKHAHCTDNEFKAIADRKVGPTITGTIKVPAKNGELGYLIQEFAVPAPLKRLFEELVTTTKVVNDLPTKDTSIQGDEIKIKPNEYDPCSIKPDAMSKTLLLGLIGHDDANGVMRLPLHEESKDIRTDQEGILQIVWPEARKGHDIETAYRRFTEYSENTFPAASVISNPMWRFLPESLDTIVQQERGPVLTVHPLGGCTIGSDSSHGVVSEYGVVFDDGHKFNDLWEDSLLVLDGSIIPGSLGANPSLTISAIALRAVERFKLNLISLKKCAVENKPIPQKLTNNIIFSKAEPQKDYLPTLTEITVTERLSGVVTLKSPDRFHQDYIFEMTLEYMPKNLLSLTGAWGDRSQIVAPKSYIRLFNFSDWNEGLLLRVADEALLDKNAIWKAEVKGSLDFFEREKKSMWIWFKTAWALLLNRGVRDLWQFFKYPKSGFKFADLFKKSFYLEKKTFLKALNNVLHRAGEVRTFQYKLKVSPYKANNNCKQNDHFENIFAGNCIKGVKRLTYNRRANPWQQMLEMKLTQFPSLASNKKSILTVDTRFLANQGIALAEISKQENQVSALLDMASFGLFMARVIINNHLLSFRMPDKLLSPQVPKRLPTKLKGLPNPDITELLVSKFDPINNKPAAKIRLTRYQGSNAKNHPVAFIHGYSANGTTFAHPSLSPSIAEYLWKNGGSAVGDRDVWVIDLRSSSGMPTATDAWSYEEIALVDIPAALLHIKTITGKKVDVVAHCVGAAMLSMAILTRAEDVITDKVQLGVATYLQNEQLGILSAFNGDGRFVEGIPTAEPHPTINSIVMSQKGPLIRYTEANIFRAYVMKFLQRWIAPEGYAFRQSETPTATEQLIDRLLSTLPYPQEEYDVENPTWPCSRTEWVTSRHRMDALYARVFNAANMSKETLACIDDFFGPLSMETVMQTIHFVRFNCITNQRGRGEFVSLQNLKNRWYGIPTFSIHGKENGMVDPATRDLIQVNFEAANIPYTNKIYDKHGHQDLFIGHSCDNVFKDIKDFLNKPQKFIVDNPSTLAKVNSAVKIWHIDTPWIGPRLQAGVRDKFGVSVSDNLCVSAISSPKYGKSQMVLVPVNFSKAHICGYTRNFNALLVNAPLTNQDWHSKDIANIAGNNNQQTWLVLMAYESDQTLIDPSNADGINFVVVPAMTVASAALNPSTLESAIDDWLLSQTKKLDHCVISSNDIEHWQKFGVKSFNFALASCQFPPGIMDRKISEKSMQALANLIDKNGKKEEDFIDFVIFAGDQIYADATAGLMDPSRSDERLDLPYETALRSASMQEIMQRVPVHMLLDDHEIVDNWEPTEPAKTPALSRREFKKKNRLLIEGLEAYCKYQLLLPVEQSAPPIRLHKENIADRDISYSFEHGDAAFYMLNTRSRREYRVIGKPHEAKMFSDASLTKLCAWLIANKDELKFIITPSMLLPRHLDALNVGIDYSTRSDSWDGYPANLEQIFNTLVENGIKNTVFLSGDEHLSCHVTATISNRGMTAKIVSIHASGLYAPFPFANAKQEDFIAGRDVFQSGNNICVTDSFFAPLEARFAKIKVSKDSYDKPTVSVEYHGASGAPCNTFELL